MSLDIELGEGATEAFEAAVTFANDAPTIIYGDWEYYSPSWLETDIEETPWPGPGIWKTATVIWADNVTQKAYFQNKVFFWGSGLCEASPDDLDRMGNAAMWAFLNNYIEEMFIDLPPLPDFIDPFLNIGFEILDDSGPLTKVNSPIYEGCRIQQWIDWREAGEPTDQKPEWRV